MIFFVFIFGLAIGAILGFLFGVSFRLGGDQDE